jgi:hypothetical protein
MLLTDIGDAGRAGEKIMGLVLAKCLLNIS